MLSASSCIIVQNRAQFICLFQTLFTLWIRLATSLIIKVITFLLKATQLLNPCLAEEIRTPLPFLIFSQSDYLIQIVDIHILNGKQCRSRSVRSQLIWINTVCKGRAYPGSAGQGLNELQRE